MVVVKEVVPVVVAVVVVVVIAIRTKRSSKQYINISISS